MANHSNLPVAELKAFGTAVDHMATVLSEGFKALKTKERQSVLKFRKGGDRIVTLLARLAREHGVVAHSTSVDEMQAKLAFADELRPFADKVRAFSRLLDDVLLVTQGQSWTLVVATYGMLRAVSLTNPALQTELAPVKEFFTSRKSAATPSADGASDKVASQPATAPVVPVVK